MNVRLAPAPRRLAVPAWVVGCVLGWGAGVVGVDALARASGADVTLCNLRRWTGIPCPTCGGTRAVSLAAHGDVFGAIATNPLVVLGLAVLLALLLVRVAAGRRLDLGLSPVGRRLAFVLCALLVLADWAYVVVRGV